MTTPVRVGPRSALERSVRKIWQEALGHRDFGVQDNFFAVGGNSLAMIHIQHRIAALAGYEIPLDALFAAPTVAGAVMLLRGSATVRPDPLVPLSRDGSGAPLFCVHPLGGSAAVYVPLADALADAPVYGLQSIGLTPGQPPHRTMDELVEAYLAAVRRVCPDGPVQLLGYSLGGLIAYAMACRLRADTGTDPLVLLLDTPATAGYDETAPYKAVGAYALHLDLDYDELRRQGREQAMATIFEEALRVGTISAAFPLERLLSIFDTAFANMAAAYDYVLPRYDGPLVSIESDDEPESFHWDRRAPRTVRLALPLPHSVMLEEKSARRVVAAVRPYLAGGPEGSR